VRIVTSIILLFCIIESNLEYPALTCLSYHTAVDGVGGVTGGEGWRGRRGVEVNDE